MQSVIFQLEVKLEIFPVLVWNEEFRVPMLIIQATAGYERKGLYSDLMSEIIKRFGTLEYFRGVNAESLNNILCHGVDVYPTNSPLYADVSLDKALEYGSGGDQVIMMLDRAGLDPTWREIQAVETDAACIFAKEFPTRLESADGKNIWFSKLPLGNTRLATDYERAYSFVIPGDPWEALICLIVISERNIDQMLGEIKKINATL